jgi:hypothetical protein
MPMRNLDKSTSMPPFLCLLIAAAVGCGDGTSAETKPDGGPDGSTAPDTAKADALALQDTAKDTPTIDGPSGADAPTADAPSPPDTATADLPQSQDASRVDARAPVDGDRTDAPAVLDSGAVDVRPGIDATPSMDALATTMASITFRLTNSGAQTVYLRNACWVSFNLTSAADGTVYTNQAFCACDCASTACTGGVQCGPCAPTSGTAVQVGGTADLAWTAQKTTLETKTGSTGAFQCVSHAAIPTGTYHFAVVVYPTAEDAVAETNGKTLQQDFVLGTANAIVAVAIQ